jgi:hypothetical protein
MVFCYVASEPTGPSLIGELGSLSEGLTAPRAVPIPERHDGTERGHCSNNCTRWCS